MTDTSVHFFFEFPKGTRGLFQLQELFDQLSVNSDPLSEEQMAKMDASDVKVVVVRDASFRSIIGFACLVPCHLSRFSFGVIHDVVVHCDWRRRGIGRSMVDLLVRNAETAGMKFVELTSRPDRKAANKMYADLGFVQKETNVYRRTFT